MTARTRTHIAWALAASSIALMTVSLVIEIASPGVFGAEDNVFIVPGLLGGLSFAIVGGLIAARTGNRVGWVFLAISGSMAVSLAAGNWVDAMGPDRPLPFLGLANWLSQWPFFLAIGLLIAVFFLFPTGAVPSPRWRVPWLIYLASLAVLVVGFAVQPSTQDVNGTVVTNPVAVEFLDPVLGVVLGVAGLILVASAFVALASLIVRTRGADPGTRQQIRWLGAVGRAGGVLFVLLLAFGITSGDRTSGFAATAAFIIGIVLVITIVVGVPVATAIAIFRHGLWNLDVVIRKTVQYATLVVVLTLVGFLLVAAVPALVFGVGSSNDLLPILALSGVLTAVFLWLRPRVARLANRLVYGRRATPYEVLSEFSERVGETYSTEDVLPRMTQLVAEATGARRVDVWLREGSRLLPRVRFPTDAETPPTLVISGDAVDEITWGYVAEVRHQGDLLGAITLEPSPSDPMDPAKETLVRDLAAQAGLVLRNVHLIEDLRASRQRLVTAQDQERRRLERDIHDGVQQQLVALTVQLRLAEQLVERDPAKAREHMMALQDRTNEALEDLRDLARGIYPPLLADQGLTAALEAQGRKSPVAVSVHAGGVARYPQAIESAVYFSCLEALNNVAKYARADHVTITMAQRNGSLTFDVSDDGRGFDVDETSYGTGLQGIADRLDAIGGTIHISSEPGHGTTLTGTVPAEESR